MPKKRRSMPEIPIKNFCDSQKAPKAIAHSPVHQDNRFLKSLIYQKTGELQWDGHSITFQWITSHSGLIGNEKADLAAKNRAKRGGRLTERWSSLEYIKRNLTEAWSKEIIKWNQIKTQERGS